MADQLQIMLELERRGKLPPDKAAILTELRRRGAAPPGGDSLPAGGQVTASLPNKFPLPEEFGVSPLEKKIGEFVLPMVLPTVGSAIGGLGGVPGIAAGSFIGEAANQALGITEPSKLQLALAGGLPLVPSILTRGFKFARRFFTPRAGAETLNRIAGPEVEHFISRFAPSGKVASLFESAKQQGGAIPMSKTLEALDDVVRELEKASKPLSVLTDAKNLFLKISGKGGVFDPADLQQELEIFGKMVSKLERAEGSPFGVGKKIFGAMMNDLDDAIKIGSPGAGTLKLARDTFKRSAVLEEVIDISNAATKALRGQGDAVSFNPAEVIRKLQADKFFKQTFSSAEQKEIFGLLTNLNKIPALRPGAGQAHGFGMLGKSLISGGIAGTLSGSQTIGAIGTLGPPAGEVMRNIWIALNMKEGRALMGRLLAGKSGLTEQGAAILAAFARTQVGRIEAAPPEAGEVEGVTTSPLTSPLPGPNPRLLPFIGALP